MALRLLISGSSGLIGSALAARLRTQGHDLVRLRRGSHRIEAGALYWDPAHDGHLGEELEGFDGVIHLAGANVGATLWTKKRKQELVDSRCRDTRLLAQALAALSSPPKTVIIASAVGYYGDRGQETLTEESPPGAGFLARLCVQWEASSRPLQERGVRVVHSRFGAVLSPQGGLLRKLLPLFRWGLGGRLGTGKQLMSWIALEDAVCALEHLLHHEEVRGPVNVTSPFPVAQEAFADLLARAVRRRKGPPLPALLVRWLFGEMGQELLLASAAALPRKLLDTGFSFVYPRIETYLQEERCSA
jgi:uncharacterized protein (TIGR01777 family)